MTPLHTRLAAFRSEVSKAIGRRDALRSQATDARDRFSGSTSRLADLEGAHALLSALCESRRKEVVRTVERVVTAALRSVFGRGVRYRLTVSAGRGAIQMVGEVGYTRTPRGQKPEVHWYTADSLAGGVVDVLSFALRTAVLMLHRPRLRPVLIADEPFKHVSAENLPAVASMLATLAERTGIQFIIISHEEEIAEEADRVFDVTRAFRSSSPASTIRAEPKRPDPSLLPPPLKRKP